MDKGPRLECLTPCDPVEYWYYNAAEAELQGPKRLHPTQVDEIFKHGGVSPVPMQMWQCGDKRMACETSFSGSSGIHAGRERRRSLGPGTDVAALLATRCGSDWLQRAPSSDVALPAMPAVRPPSLQPGAASGRGARCLRADVAGVSPYGSDAEIGRTWPFPVRLWQRSS